VTLLSISTWTSAVAIPQRGPRVLLLPVTMRCNARCGMCTIWQQEPVGFSGEDTESLFADGVLGGDLEYLGLTGGEPTTHPAFNAVSSIAIRHAPRLREVTFNTNGFLTAKVLAAVDFLLECLAGRDIRLGVYISLDGVGEVHDRVRGIRDAFRRTEKTILKLKEAYGGSQQVHLALNSVVCRDNAEYVEPTFRFAHQLSLPIHFSLVMSTDVCIDSKASEIPYEIEPGQVPGLRRYFSRLRALARTRGGVLENDYYDHLLTMLDGLPRQLGCPFAAGEGCLIHPTGDVYPCGMSKAMWMGNARYRSFGQIWRDPVIWGRLRADLPQHCAGCESNCFVHAAEQRNA
jgi:MoaA/NifB/PqqE/SkfB family radical SAM enzyme